ncbi:DUF948 domain-containing protein [Geomonas sp. RF6]|uniref:DUF948 domain-containing protein n=1 Tax=Geomonas sp. RF6 TaxID=2897342 RepID=UPI001E486CB0|nr:DUF948 domain-containing protein [Geomonas sp. RF6]UFS71605.1 DUF948 domain-containing protein [Geomonas sp. RF6]
MLLLGIASAVTAVTLVVLTSFLIPTLMEMKKAAAALRSVAEKTEAQLEPLLMEARSAVAEVRIVTASVAANADGVSLLMEELGETGEHIRAINRVVGVVSTLVAGSSAWMTGARVAGRFIADKLIRKRG